MAVGFKALAMVLKNLLRFSLSKLFLLSLSSHLPHDIFWLLNQILPHNEESAHLDEGPLISSATDYWPQSFLRMNTKSTEERHMLDDLWCRENYKHTHTHTPLCHPPPPLPLPRWEQPADWLFAPSGWHSGLDWTRLQWRLRTGKKRVMMKKPHFFFCFSSFLRSPDLPANVSGT